MCLASRKERSRRRRKVLAASRPSFCSGARRLPRLRRPRNLEGNNSRIKRVREPLLRSRGFLRKIGLFGKRKTGVRDQRSENREQGTERRLTVAARVKTPFPDGRRVAGVETPACYGFTACLNVSRVKLMRKRIRVALANRSRVRVDGSTLPLSRRAMTA